MKNTLWIWLLPVAFALVSGCSSVTVDDYASNTPVLVAEEFLTVS